MSQYSLTEFLPIVKENLFPKLITQGELNCLKDIFIVRPKIKNTQKFLLSCQNGIVSTISYSGQEYILTKNIKHELLATFTDHSTLLDESYLELLIGPLNTYYINDIFLCIDNTLEPNKKRFDKMLKLFRETIRSPYFTFNLAHLSTSVLLTEQKFIENDIFAYQMFTNQILILEHNPI